MIRVIHCRAIEADTAYEALVSLEAARSASPLLGRMPAYKDLRRQILQELERAFSVEEIGGSDE